MQRTYEIMFIVRPDLADEDVDKLVATMETNITTAGGTVTGTQRMGKRRMAYAVRKFNDGNYILFNVEGAGGVVKEVERRLRVAEQVIKFITVRTDQEGKRLEKVRLIRESHRRGQGRQAAEAAGANEPSPGTEPASLEV
jgi:small subunit ribosomal protein S6